MTVRVIYYSQSVLYHRQRRLRSLIMALIIHHHRHDIILSTPSTFKYTHHRKVSIKSILTALQTERHAALRLFSGVNYNSALACILSSSYSSIIILVATFQSFSHYQSSTVAKLFSISHHRSWPNHRTGYQSPKRISSVLTLSSSRTSAEQQCLRPRLSTT